MIYIYIPGNSAILHGLISSKNRLWHVMVLSTPSQILNSFNKWPKNWLGMTISQNTEPSFLEVFNNSQDVKGVVLNDHGQYCIAVTFKTICIVCINIWPTNAQPNLLPLVSGKTTKVPKWLQLDTLGDRQIPLADPKFRQLYHSIARWSVQKGFSE